MGTMRLRTRELGDVLYAEVEGEVELPLAMELYQQLVRQWSSSGATGILIDCRRLTGTLTDMQRYEIGVAVAASYGAIRDETSRLPRIAMVAHPPLLEPRRFIQTVASNRGALLHAAETIEEAARWLGLDPSLLVDSSTATVGRLDPGGR
jgi:hypothetical protein